MSYIGTHNVPATLSRTLKRIDRRDSLLSTSTPSARVIESFAIYLVYSARMDTGWIAHVAIRPIAAAGSTPADKAALIAQVVAVSEHGPGEALPLPDSFPPALSSEDLGKPIECDVVPLLD